MRNRVAIYARISSDPENDETGVKRQVRACEEHATAKNLQVMETFIDNDFSASDRRLNRPQWGKLLQLVADRKIDGIVCWHQDRLYRRLTDLETLADSVKGQTLTIYPVSGDSFELHNSSGVFIAGLLTVAAKFESQHKAERQVAKHRELAAEGKWHGGKMPTGYKQIDGKGPLVIDEPIAQALRESARQLLRGHSLRSVTQTYQKTTGHKMADTSLRRVLVGPVIAGIRMYSPEDSKNDKVRMHLPSGTIQVPAQWEAILDRETWIALKALLLDPGRKTRGITSELSLLSGILICGRQVDRHICGKSLGYGQKAYICNYSSGGCNKMSISTARIEEYIQGLVSAMIHAEDFQLPSQKVKTEDEATLTKRKRLQQNFDTSYDLFTQGVIDGDQLKVARERLNEQLGALGSRPKPKAAIEAEEAELSSLISKWDIAGRPERRIVIKSLIDRIVITTPDAERAKANGGRFDYERAEIQWATWDENGHRIRPAPIKQLSQVAMKAAKK